PQGTDDAPSRVTWCVFACQRQARHTLPPNPSRPARPPGGETAMTCEHCKPLILDHLYGLLDGPDAAAVEAHLRDCPACAAAPAARGAGSGSAGGRTYRVAAWLPWAVAAAVLVAIPGTVVPVLGILNRAESARRDADTSVARVTVAEGDADKAREAAERPRAD